ncbi:MAG: hypothetical protein ACM3XO_19170 [Bacteroidota bacterium]
MPRRRKYPLIVYRHMLDRWWPAMIAMGLGLFAMAYGEYIDPLSRFIPWRWQLCVGVGSLAILVGLFFIIIRHFAYVQVFPNYLKLVTPFFHLNISRKRITRTSTSEMRLLFPRKSMSWWVQDIFSPLATQTAVVVELTGYPVSPRVMRMFLSRFFFKDKTPHLVVLVKDWMGFSTELESMRSNTDPSSASQQKRSRDSILSRLPQK